MYKKDSLKEYINHSELRVFSKGINVRLSKELALKYDQGVYNNYLNNLNECLNMVNTLNITYPGNANPILYVYIVPDDCYSELLQIPKTFDKGRGGGKPVLCYDLNGFNKAYGLSQNILENMQENQINISRIENQIHELAHIIHGQFFSKNQSISEGFAETLPLYGLNLEELFDDHRNMLLQLDQNQVLTVQELLNSEKDGTFGEVALLPNRSCAFRLSYISSYLFVRSCIETLSKTFSLSRAQSIQKFLEIIRQSKNYDEYLIYDIADSIGIDKNELLNSKKLQIELLNSFSNKRNKKSKSHY